jgi:hypothetical protein
MRDWTTPRKLAALQNGPHGDKDYMWKREESPEEAIEQFATLCIQEGHEWSNGQCHLRVPDIKKSPAFAWAIALSCLVTLFVLILLGVLAWKQQVKKLQKKRRRAEDPTPIQMVDNERD